MFKFLFTRANFGIIFIKKLHSTRFDIIKVYIKKDLCTK